MHLTEINHTNTAEGVQLSFPHFEALINERQQLYNDISLTAKNMRMLLNALGAINESGQLDFKPGKVIRSLTPILLDQKKAGEQFNFLQELIPLLHKYSNL